MHDYIDPGLLCTTLVSWSELEKRVVWVRNFECKLPSHTRQFASFSHVFAETRDRPCGDKDYVYIDLIASMKTKNMHQQLRERMQYYVVLTPRPINSSCQQVYVSN